MNGRMAGIAGVLVAAALAWALGLPVDELLAPPREGPAPQRAGEQALVLAVTWQPAFCETAPGRPECRRLGPGDPAALGFSLHGLWPQPKANVYCGRAAALAERRWSDLPEPELDAPTREALVRLMPGSVSGLHRHQWAKHGSCYGTAADEYFDDALRLTEEINRSALADAMRARIGRRIAAEEIRAAADRAFGRGAGARLRVVCRDGMVTELRLHLRGEIGPGSRLEALLADAARAGGGCRGGRVDPA